MNITRKLKMYFLASYDNTEFIYLLHPFLCIYKFFGFLPIKFRNWNWICLEKCQKVHWDLRALCWTVLTTASLTAGFALGVYHLSCTEHWTHVRDASIIAYVTNWLQIFALFLLGFLALITSWTTLHEMQKVCYAIYSIDLQLEQLTTERVDYQRRRRHMFVQFFVAMFIPITLSMVNCVVIQPSRDVYTLTSTCYWFICFSPIMLITLKEFQFYNLLILLQKKFECVNCVLRKYKRDLGCFAQCNTRKIFNTAAHWKKQSLSEIPLVHIKATSPPTATAAAATELVKCQMPSLEELQCLLLVYSCIADNVENILRIFASYLVVSTTVSFGVITIQSYNLFSLIMHSLELQPYEIVFIIAWILVQLGLVGINVCACSTISKSMSATGPILHKIACDPNMKDANLYYQIIQTFSLEVLHRKNSISAAGFFNMDPKLITSIIAAVTTYLIIIIQFHLTNVSNVFKNK